MGNPHLEDMDPTAKELTGVDPKDNIAHLDDFQLRANPNCKTLQQDLAKVHNIVRVTNAEILKSVSNGYDSLTKLLTDNKDGVYTRLKSLEQSTSTYEERLAAVEEKLAKVETSDHVTLQASPALEAVVANANRCLNTTAVILGRFEKKFDSANSRTLHNTQLANVNNYKISGIPFQPDEDPVAATKLFFTDMNIKVNNGEIVTALRIPGMLVIRIWGNRVELPPQMFVKVTAHLQKRIASNIKELDDKTDPINGHYYKVRQQIPDASQAARQHYHKIVSEQQEKNKVLPVKERLPIYFQGHHCYIGGKRVCEPVDPPSLSSLLSIEPKHQAILDDINLEPLAQEKRSGSRFFGYAAHVYGFSMIDKIYLRLRQQHLAADHIMLAYRLADPDSPDQ